MVRAFGKKVRKYSAYIILTGLIFLPGAVKYYSLSIQKAQNQAKLKALIEENRQLAEDNKKLKNDPVYIEKMARENLGLAKKGEVVVKFKNNVPPKSQR